MPTCTDRFHLSLTEEMEGASLYRERERVVERQGGSERDAKTHILKD